MCNVCYVKIELEEKRLTGCSGGCICCKDCLKNNITSQFNRNSDMSRIRCICRTGDLPEETLVAILDEKDYTRFSRLRLSRKIDLNPNAIWCPNLGCE
mmetsp:Transcript_22478/g.26377  ORF Transcript_22478/g.26377 Transcript_22478/m.26377 type:complete len:98 (+) Transcript_22478:1064-1357(+)